jgi:hypothetical protein
LFHEVLPKETVSIAKKYDISIDELEKKSEIVANLPVGFKLIKGNPSTSLTKVEKSTVRDPAKEMVQVLLQNQVQKIKYRRLVAERNLVQVV